MLTEVEGRFARRPLSVLPPDHHWSSLAGLTIIADAAQAMPPFTGRGVNLALPDALELALALTADPSRDVAEAIRAFEAAMQARTLRETSARLEVGRHFYGIEMDFAEIGAAA